MIKRYKGWFYKLVETVDHEGHREYHIAFWKQRNSWYDEVRYDSHEIKRGVKHMMPHFHIKIQSTYMKPEKVLKDLKMIIDRHLPSLRRLSKR